jgi:hypothetical protein
METPMHANHVWLHSSDSMLEQCLAHGVILDLFNVDGSSTQPAAYLRPATALTPGREFC